MFCTVSVLGVQEYENPLVRSSLLLNGLPSRLQLLQHAFAYIEKVFQTGAYNTFSDPSTDASVMYPMHANLFLFALASCPSVRCRRLAQGWAWASHVLSQIRRAVSCANVRLRIPSLGRKRRGPYFYRDTDIPGLVGRYKYPCCFHSWRVAAGFARFFFMSSVSPKVAIST
jgi:hypothetical protein